MHLIHQERSISAALEDIAANRCATQSLCNLLLVVPDWLEIDVRCQ